MKQISASVSKGRMQLFFTANNIYNTGTVSKKSMITKAIQILI